MSNFRILGVAIVLRPVLASALLVAAVAGAGGAQAPTDSVLRPKQRPAARGGRAANTAGLELSADQKTKLEAISRKHADEGRAVAELFGTDPDAAMKQMVALRARMQGEVRLVLTSEQRAIFDRNMAGINAQVNAHLSPAPH